MRVTLVNRLAGIQRGGGEIYDLSLAAALQRAGASVDLITGRPLLRRPIALPPDLPSRIVRTPYLRGLAHRLGAPGWRLLDLDLLIFERGVDRLLRAADPAPDVVQVTGLPRLAHRLERRGTSRVVLLFPGPPSPRHRDEIRSCRTVAGVGAVTPYLRERFGREIRDMTGGVDAETFRPGRASLRETLGIPPGVPVLLYSGRLVPLKNIPGLVDLFAAVRAQRRDARLLVVGDGPLRHDLRSRAARAGLKVERAPSASDVVLAGEIPHAEMPGCYAAADLLLLASENESFSLAALEAMACGLPVVAPRVGYLPRLVDDGVTGRLYPAGDTAAGAAHALVLLDDDAERAREGMAARERAVRLHSWDAVAAEFHALYRELLAG